MLVNVGKNGQKVKRKATWNGQDQQEVGLARCWERVRFRIQSCRKRLTGMTGGMEIVLKGRVGRFFLPLHRCCSASYSCRSSCDQGCRLLSATTQHSQDYWHSPRLERKAEKSQ